MIDAFLTWSCNIVYYSYIPLIHVETSLNVVQRCADCLRQRKVNTARQSSASSERTKKKHRQEHAFVKNIRQMKANGHTAQPTVPYSSCCARVPCALLPLSLHVFVKLALVSSAMLLTCRGHRDSQRNKGCLVWCLCILIDGVMYRMSRVSVAP